MPGIVRPWFDRDEAEIAVEAQAILRGEHLYRDVLDRKPPLVQTIYAATQLAVGSDLRPTRFLLALWVAGTALLVFGIARRLGASQPAAAAGAVLYVLGSVAFVPRDGQAANFELWAALPAAGAVFVAVRAGARPPLLRFVLAGGLVGAAACCKQPFVTTIVAVAVAAWLGPQRVRALCGAAVGLAGVFIIVGGVFGLGGMVRWAWMENRDYLVGNPGIGAIAGTAAVATGLFLVAHLPAVWLAVQGGRRGRPIPLVAVAWFLAGAASAAAGLRFSGHYYQQAVAPLCVLAAVGADRVSSLTRRTVLAAGAAIAAVAVVAAFSTVGPTPMRIDSVLAVVARETTPSDRILIWGSAPEIAWRADRPIAGGFVHSGWLTTLWSDDSDAPTPIGRAIAGDERLARRWREYLAAVRCGAPKLVIDTSPRGVAGFDRYPLESSPLGPYLERRYDDIGVVGGMKIWRARGDADSRRRPARCAAAGTTTKAMGE